MLGESPLIVAVESSPLQSPPILESPEQTKSCLESLVKSSRPKVVQSRQKVTQSLVKSSQVLSSLVKSGRQKFTKATLRSIHEKQYENTFFMFESIFSCLSLRLFLMPFLYFLVSFYMLCVRSVFEPLLGGFGSPKSQRSERFFQRSERFVEVLATKAPQWAPKAAQ